LQKLFLQFKLFFYLGVKKMLKQAILSMAVLGTIFAASQAQAQSVTLSNGALIIQCRAGVHENVRVRPGSAYNAINRIDRIIVQRTNGSLLPFDARDVRQIIFVGNTGNDTCILETNFRGETVSDANRDWGRGAMPVSMIGRSGNDTLNSGEETDDTLDGGSGEDILSPGSTGNDTVTGGPDADDFILYYRWTNIFPYRQYTTFPTDYNYFGGDRIYGKLKFYRFGF
jgi:Ca2+-binding RTX toxin-like protein